MVGGPSSQSFASCFAQNCAGVRLPNVKFFTPGAVGSFGLKKSGVGGFEGVVAGFGAGGLYTGTGFIVGAVGATSQGRIIGATFGWVAGVGWTRGATIVIGAITF